MRPLASVPALVLLLALALPAPAEPPDGPSVRGNVALSWYHFDDLSDDGLDYDRPVLRLKMRADGLLGGGYDLSLRLRSRYDSRARAFGDDVPATEWRNRLYEASFSFNDSRAPLNFSVGRLASDALRSHGPVDGVLVRHNASERWRWGAFAGSRPDWESSEPSADTRVYGLYASYAGDPLAADRVDVALAAVGEYHGTVISRESLSQSGGYRRGRRWSVHESLVLDVNRGWRSDAAGERVSISAVNLNGRIAWTDGIATTLGYDRRTNYRTYETRSLAEGLFDDAFRQGYRAAVSARLGKRVTLHGSLGFREKESDRGLTTRYSAALRGANVPARGVTVRARVAGYTNDLSNGFTPSVTLGRVFGRGHSMHVTYGAYYYDLALSHGSRLNQWTRVEAQVELPARFYLSTHYEYDWGDDAEGQRIFAEVGHRF
ncbi:MAG: hypothetical protein ABIG03_05720 [Candidatus Eisenbacteria bacterium]